MLDGYFARKGLGHFDSPVIRAFEQIEVTIGPGPFVSLSRGYF